jgi:Domain of unknown function (DUF4124)
MRTALLLLLIAFATSASADTQTVWKWVDDKGVTHYSDRPVPGATKIELNVSSRSQDDDDGPPPAYTPNRPAFTEPPAQRGPVYRNFEIWKPAPDEVIPNTGGAVTVNIRVDPGLQSGHTLRLSLDGRLVDGFPPNTTSYDLTNVPRGTHVAIAQIFDQRGSRVQETAPVSFTVRQESIAQPPVGPALRPPPKPQPRGAVNKLPDRQPTYAALNGAPAQIDPRTNKPVVPPKKPKGPKQGS